MASILYKWFFAASLMVFCSASVMHPVFVSVTEIEHNAKDRTLEISCKIFTDDLEKTLRAAYKARVDLVKPSNRESMNTLLNDYIQKHLKLNVDGKNTGLRFLGYEVIEEGVYSYFQADGINTVSKLTVTNNLLYEYKQEQMGLMHITVNGIRKSGKLVNPDDQAVFSF